MFKLGDSKATSDTRDAPSAAVQNIIATCLLNILMPQQ